MLLPLDKQLPTWEATTLPQLPKLSKCLADKELAVELTYRDFKSQLEKIPHLRETILSEEMATMRRIHKINISE